MLLETLDIKKNDLIIYSQNLFSFEDNFKVLFKDDPELKPVNITYQDVCECVNEFTPKSLIVYRLLTNIDYFAISPSRYGFYVTINDAPELIYFDPIFALKEIEEYISVSEDYNLRFRIQQVGLTTLTRKNNTVNYAEIFSIDLTGAEALNENDKVFVDALLSSGSFPESSTREPSFLHKITEDNEYDISRLVKVNSYPALSADVPRHQSFSEFLRKKTAEIAEKRKLTEVSPPIMDILYSNESLERVIEGKKNMSIVLKLETEEQQDATNP